MALNLFLHPSHIRSFSFICASFWGLVANSFATSFPGVLCPTRTWEGLCSPSSPIGWYVDGFRCPLSLQPSGGFLLSIQRMVCGWPSAIHLDRPLRIELISFSLALSLVDLAPPLPSIPLAGLLSPSILLLRLDLLGPAARSNFPYIGQNLPYMGEINNNPSKSKCKYCLHKSKFHSTPTNLIFCICSSTALTWKTYHQAAHGKNFISLKILYFFENLRFLKKIIFLKI